jgi:hypothetical protein
MDDPRGMADGRGLNRASGRYVVVGASGILAPLGALLGARGLRTVGVSRGSRLGEGVWDERVALDTQDAAAVGDWVAGQAGDVSTVVAYSPAVAPASWPPLGGLAARVMVVATSRWAAPGAPAPPWAGLAGVVVLQLGWAGAGPGSRWHTPAEVSAAVLEELVVPWRPRTALLGSVRPWSARPR